MTLYIGNLLVFERTYFGTPPAPPNTKILYQIYTGDYIYAADSEGLSIYDIESNSLFAYATFNGGFSTLGGNIRKIYLGTSNEGLKYIDINTISGSVITPYDLTLNLNNVTESGITSDVIKYLHVKDDQLLVCTDTGVDYFSYNTNPYIHSKTFIAGATKCFVTNDNGYYINTLSGVYNLNRIDMMLCDWSVPSYSYTTGGGIFKNNIEVTDMYITEYTTKNNLNTIFCTTTSGVYVIDEGSKEYSIYYTR